VVEGVSIFRQTHSSCSVRGRLYTYESAYESAYEYPPTICSPSDFLYDLNRRLFQISTRIRMGIRIACKSNGERPSTRTNQRTNRRTNRRTNPRTIWCTEGKKYISRNRKAKIMFPEKFNPVQFGANEPIARGK
jgi:hypothetical protein